MIGVVVLRRRRLWLLFIPWPALIYVAVFAGLAGVGEGVRAVMATASVHGSLRGRVVAVDPGHGGQDGGVHHPGEGLIEKEINLDLARRVAGEITRRGGRAVLTRGADVAYYVDSRQDLSYRLGLAYAAGAGVFLSLHANSFPDPSQFGAQTFYHEKSPEGRRLALLIQEELVRIHPENYREALAADLFVLRENRLPAVLVEVGFVSNADDRARLSDTAWRAQLAEAVVRGLERWFAGEGM